jgi:hypothetical protein
MGDGAGNCPRTGLGAALVLPDLPFGLLLNHGIRLLML